MTGDEELERMGRQLASIGRIEKCRGCSCYVETVQEYRELLHREGNPEVEPLLRKAEELLRGHPTEHGCLGCNPCYPVAVSNRIHERPGASEHGGLDLPVLQHNGPNDHAPGAIAWPLVPGEYVVGNVRASVAVSTLGSPDLAQTLVNSLGLSQIAIIGKTETENIGVEKVVANVVVNTAIRSLILCGDDAFGHRPGATFLALGEKGIDGQGRVIGSPGRRPFLRNVSTAEISAFRAQIEIIDIIGEKDAVAIGQRVAAAASKVWESLPARSAGPTGTIDEAGPPPPWVPDPAGYLVILLDRPAERIVLEHYDYQDRLTGALAGRSAKVLYHGAITRGWVSRLDHAAYIGRELARALRAIEEGTPYVQDAA